MLPGSEPWFGSVRPKQPIHSPVASLGRYFCFVRLGAELVDRHHHQRRLHAHHRAVAGVDALDLARDQAVADVVERRRRRTPRESSGRAGRARPSRERSRRRSSRGGSASSTRGASLLLAVGARGVAHRALVVGELLRRAETGRPTGRRRACVKSSSRVSQSGRGAADSAADLLLGHDGLQKESGQWGTSNSA